MLYPSLDKRRFDNYNRSEGLKFNTTLNQFLTSEYRQLIGLSDIGNDFALAEKEVYLLYVYWRIYLEHSKYFVKPTGICEPFFPSRTELGVAVELQLKILGVIQSFNTNSEEKELYFRKRYEKDSKDRYKAKEKKLLTKRFVIADLQRQGFQGKIPYIAVQLRRAEILAYRAIQGVRNEKR